MEPDRAFAWACPCCRYSGHGTEAWESHSARCPGYRAWIAELRAELHMAPNTRRKAVLEPEPA
jgi:hypothetical protein